MNKPPENATAGVVIPLAQALITGALVGGVVAAGALLLELPRVEAWALGAGAIVALYSWLEYRQAWAARTAALAGLADELQDKRENQTSVRMHLSYNEDRAGDFLTLPDVTADQVRALATGLILDGRGLALHAWTGSGRPFKRAQFEAVRGELLARGLARKVNPGADNSPLILTGKGRAVFAHLARPAGQQPPTAPPPGFDAIQRRN